MIRRATPDDAGALARVQVRAWLHAYSDYVDPSRLAGFTEAGQEPRWRAWLDDEALVWVFDQDGTQVGFAAVGPSRNPETESGTGELYAIYVDPSAQGAGVGTRLLEQAVESLRSAGFAGAILWTFAENGLARRFYEQSGWRCDGEPVLRPDEWAPVVRYRRELTC